MLLDSTPPRCQQLKPRRGTKRQNLEQQARLADEERKEAPAEERQRSHPSSDNPRIPPLPLNSVNSPHSRPSSSSSAPSSPVVGDQSGGAAQQKMEFVPRPEAVTHAVEYGNAQTAGLPAVAHALCEYIDNALPALRKSMQREPGMQPEIKILFVEPTWEWATTTRKMFILIRYGTHTTAEDGIEQALQSLSTSLTSLLCAVLCLCVFAVTMVAGWMQTHSTRLLAWSAPFNTLACRPSLHSCCTALLEQLSDCSSLCVTLLRILFVRRPG